MGGARASAGQKSPIWVQYKFLRFPCTKFLNFINTGAELGQYFVCIHNIEKQIEHSTGGLNTHTSPLHQRVFSLSRQHGILEATTVECTQVYDACPNSLRAGSIVSG